MTGSLLLYEIQPLLQPSRVRQKGTYLLCHQHGRRLAGSRRGRVLGALEAVKTEQATDSAGHVLQIS